MTPAPKLPVRRRGLMFVLSSPSGAGKTTLSRRMLEAASPLKQQGEGATQMSISVTTRPRRPNEIEGQDYYFVDEKEFQRMAKAGELLEHARVFDYHYGTPAKRVEDALSKGIDVLFDIDWQGTRQLGQRNREDLVSVFILPPSMAELERRLKTRAQDADEVVKRRMSKAASEISHWEEYDYVLINNDLEETLRLILAILQAERLKRHRQLDLADFVQDL